MNILIVDRDDITVQLIKSKLEPLGHKITHEPAKNKAEDMLANQDFDIVIIDPAPLTSAKPTVLNLRRATRKYPYIILLSEDANTQDAIKSGMNDALIKPIDTEQLDRKIKNARVLLELINRIGDDSEDFPSAGGVIAKSAFNQLFLSALDRADRYGEKTFVLFITLSNYRSIYELDGPYAADYTVAKLCKRLVHLRRQSDIIGQTERYEYALLLQRPVYETEPMEAAKRFAATLDEYEDLAEGSKAPIEITVSLVDVPTGKVHMAHKMTKGEEKKAEIA